jgi:NADPH-dependent curcumin reductase CurA
MLAGWAAAGKVVSEQTVLRGFAAVPDAFLGLFSGANTGKMLVAVEEDGVVRDEL